jgi:ubiquinol-cytochrome c reductase cytochrome b subunit
MDADGTINYSIKNNYPQLTISVTNKLLMDVLEFKNVFGGNIYFDKTKNGCYKWCIQKRSDIEFFLNYIKCYPCRSFKKQRFFLVKLFYELRDIKAFRTDCYLPLKKKAWNIFINK